MRSTPFPPPMAPDEGAVRRQLIEAITDYDVPRWRRQEERLTARLTIDTLLQGWPADVPLPTSPRDIQRVATDVLENRTPRELVA